MRAKALTVKEALQSAAGYLAKRRLRSPRQDADLLVASVLQRDRTFLYTYPEHQLSSAQQDLFQQWLIKRGEHYPLQYLRGKQEFYGREFSVRPGVFIPRPETELVLEAALGLLRECPEEQLRAADVGTGSGCIGITLVCEEPRVVVTATDVSPIALKVARQNAKKHRCLSVVIISMHSSGCLLSQVSRISTAVFIKSPESLYFLFLTRSSILYDGYPLLFSFYSRLLPVKIVVTELGHLIERNKSEKIELMDLRVNAYDVAEEISKKISSYEKEHGIPRNEKMSTGLPKKGKDENDDDKIAMAQKRFKDQFIGKIRKNRVSKTEQFEGAAAALGLVYATKEGNTTFVSLIEDGKEFFLMENSVVQGEYKHVHTHTHTHTPHTQPHTHPNTHTHTHPQT